MEPKKFDELYAEIFSKVEKESEGIDSFIFEMLKVKISSSKSHSHSSGFPLTFPIIHQPPEFILEKFLNQISESYEPKNERRSRELLSEYQNQISTQNNNGESLLEILNTALRLAPCSIQDALSISSLTSVKQSGDSLLTFMNKDRERDSSSIERNNSKMTSEEFIPPLLLEEETENLLAQIYMARSHWFRKNGDHESSILDTLRAIRLAPNGNSYSTALNLGMSYKELGLRPEATDLFQYALQLLRQSSADNGIKSTETVKIVTQLKEMKSEDWNPRPVLQQHYFNTPKLFGKRNTILIAGSDALDLRFNERLGRHLVANRHIPPGSTLIVEEAFATSIHPKNFQYYCQHCCKRVKAFLPCTQCSVAIFCASCWTKAESYHKFECSIFGLLDSIALGEMARLAYRTITTGKVKESYESLTTSEVQAVGMVVDVDEDEVVSPFCVNEKLLGVDENGRLNPNDFRSVLAQATNFDKRSKNDILKRTLGAIYLTLCLRFTNYFHEDKKSKVDNKDILALSNCELKVCSLILRIFQSVSCNAYGINSVKFEGPLNSSGLDIIEIGGGTYPTVSTMNHSCAPNVYRFYKGSVCIVKSICDIKKGEELLDSYGPNYTTTSREIRQDLLFRQYFFRCQCLACEGNWPIYSLLNNERNEQKTGKKDATSSSLFRQSEKQYLSFKASLISGDRRTVVADEAETAFSHHLSILQKFYPQPHKLIVECQEILKLVWNISDATLR